MSMTASLRRRGALLAVAAGFGVYATSLGGLATVDTDLRAVAPLDTGELVQVSDERPGAGERDCGRDDEPLNREL
jgi:hypothetical protein